MKEKIRLAELLGSVISKMEQKLQNEDFKLTIADIGKLMQMEQELEQGEAKEIRVPWVEPAATSESETSE